MGTGAAVRKLLEQLGMSSLDDLLAGLSKASPNPHGVTEFPFFADPHVQNAYNDLFAGTGEYSVKSAHWNELPPGGLRVGDVPVDSTLQPELPFTDNLLGLPFGTKDGGEATRALKELLESNQGRKVTPELFAKAEAEGGLPYALGPKKYPTFLKDPIPQYHATISPTRFSMFDPNRTRNNGQAMFDRLGVHMGTEDAAKHRGMVGTDHMRELVLDTSNPFTPQIAWERAMRIPDSDVNKGFIVSRAYHAKAADPDVWADEGKANLLLRELDRYPETGTGTGYGPDLGRKLGKEGYTHLPYVNAIEDAGSISNIALTDRPGQTAILRDVDAWNHPQLKHLPNLMAGAAGAGAAGLAAMPTPADASEANMPDPRKTTRDQLLADIDRMIAAATGKRNEEGVASGEMPLGAVKGPDGRFYDRYSGAPIPMTPAAPKPLPPSFFSPDPTERRAALDNVGKGIDEGLRYYTNNHPSVQLLDILAPQPVNYLMDSMRASGNAAAPGLSMSERAGYAGQSLSNLGYAALDAMDATGYGLLAAKGLDAVDPADLLRFANAEDGAAKLPKALRAAEDKAERAVMTKVPSIRNMTVEEADYLLRQEPHIIPKKGGGYVGAPQWVQTPEDLAALRARIDDATLRGVEGRDWYERYGKAIDEVTGGDPEQADIVSAVNALYSPQRTPQTELQHALHDTNSAIANGGIPDRTNFPDQWEKTKRAYIEGPNTPDGVAAKLREGLSDKTSVYAYNINPNNLAYPKATGANDLWQGRLYGYNQESTFSDAPHKFMDYETALAAKRANAAATGGFTNWNGPRVQAAPWVIGKADDIYGKSGKRLRTAARAELGEAATEEAVEVRAKQLAFDEANRTMADFLDENTAFATHEAMPYNAANHLPDLGKASPLEKALFENDPRSQWNFASGGRDALYAGMGVEGGPKMRVRPTLEAQGIYQPPTGPLETNRVNVARPLVSSKGDELEPGSKAIMDAVEAMRGYVDVQGATPWHKPLFGASTPSLQSAVITTGGKTDPEVMLKLREIGAKYGNPDVVDTGKGLTFGNFAEAWDEGVAKRPNLTPTQLDEMLAEVQALVPDAMHASRAKLATGYPSYEGKWEMPPGQGRVTQQLLDYLDALPPTTVEALDRNPALAKGALDRLLRDEDFAKAFGGVREDIQNARKVLGEGPGGISRLRALLAAMTAAGALYAGPALPSDRQ